MFREIIEGFGAYFGTMSFIRKHRLIKLLYIRFKFVIFLLAIAIIVASWVSREAPLGHEEPHNKQKRSRFVEKVHVVQPRDTIKKICKKHEISEDLFRELNGLDPYVFLIYPGQSFLIPKKDWTLELKVRLAWFFDKHGLSKPILEPRPLTI